MVKRKEKRKNKTKMKNGPKMTEPENLTLQVTCFMEMVNCRFIITYFFALTHSFINI